MVCFFLTIGTLGLTTIALSGQWIVFASLNPLASLAFAWRHPYGAWIALQSVRYVWSRSCARCTDAFLVLFRFAGDSRRDGR